MATRVPAPKRKPNPAATAADGSTEDAATPNKRPRVVPAEDHKVAEPLRDVMADSEMMSPSKSSLVEATPRNTSVTAFVPGRMAKLLGESDQDEEDETIPVDVLMRPVDNKIVPLKMLRRVQDVYLNAILTSLLSDPLYFGHALRNGLSTASVELKLKDHPTGSAIPYKIGSLTRGGPMFESPMLMGVYGASKITARAGKAMKDRYSKDDKKDGSGGGGDNSGNTYFLEAKVLSGNHELARAQQDFLHFLQEEVFRFALVLTCKEKDTAMNAKTKVQEALLNRPKEGWRGPYEDMDSVPRDNEKLREFVEQWRQNRRVIVMNKDLSAGAENVRAFTFTANADEGWGAAKKEWKPLKTSYVFVNRRRKVKEIDISDEATIEELLQKAPFTVVFSFKVNFSKNDQNINVKLNIERIRFYPQLHDIVQPLLNAKISTDDMISDEDAKALDAMATAHMAAKGMPLAITHTSSSSA